MRKPAIAIIAITILSVGSERLAAEQKSSTPSSSVLSLCNALEHVKTGGHETITVSAIFVSGLENSFLYDPSCHNGEPATWVEFDKGVKSGRLDRILKKSNRAYVEFKGEFYGPKPINSDTSLPDVVRRSGRRYGHLGGYKTMLIVHSIQKAESVPNNIPHPEWPKESNSSL